MSNLEKKLDHLNPVKNTLTFKLLNSISTNNSLTDTIDLYQHLKDVDHFKNHLNDETFNYSFNFHINSNLSFISKSNVGIDVIKKFATFSQNLKKTHMSSTEEGKANHHKNYQAFLQLLQNEIIDFKIAHKSELFSLNEQEFEMIDTFASNPTEDSIKKLNQTLYSINPELQYFNYPIFSLLIPLKHKDCLDTLTIWLDNGVITKEHFNSDLQFLDLDNFNTKHIVLDKVNQDKVDEVLDIFKLMETPLSKNCYLLSKIDHCETIKNIIEEENINPYENFEYKFISNSQTKTTTLHKLVSEGALIEKQPILEMFANSKFSINQNPETLKNEEFLNLALLGHSAKDLKQFITTRKIDFKSLIYTNLKNKSVANIISKHSNWWLIPFFVYAENELLNEGKETPQLLTRFIHTNNESKYTNQLISNLGKIMTEKTLSLNIDNIRNFFTKSFENSQFSIPKLLFKTELNYRNDNLFYKILSIYFDKQDYEKTFDEKKMNLPFDSYIQNIYSYYGNEHTNHSAYFFSMYTIKSHTDKKDDFLTDITKIKASSFYDTDNKFYISNFHTLLNDYFIGSKFFPVSPENSLKMENKILDIMAEFMYNIYKDDLNSRKKSIREAVVSIHYTLSTLETHTQDKKRLKSLILNNDTFIDSFFAFTEVLKDYNFHDPLLNAQFIHNIKEYLVDKARELYMINLEATMPTNNQTNKIKKF